MTIITLPNNMKQACRRPVHDDKAAAWRGSNGVERERGGLGSGLVDHIGWRADGQTKEY